MGAHNNMITNSVVKDHSIILAFADIILIFIISTYFFIFCIIFKI